MLKHIELELQCNSTIQGLISISIVLEYYVVDIIGSVGSTRYILYKILYLFLNPQCQNEVILNRVLPKLLVQNLNN